MADILEDNFKLLFTERNTLPPIKRSRSWETTFNDVSDSEDDVLLLYIHAESLITYINKITLFFFRFL